MSHSFIPAGPVDFGERIVIVEVCERCECDAWRIRHLYLADKEEDVYP